MFEGGRKLAAHQAVSSHLSTARYQSEQLDEYKRGLELVERDVVELLRGDNTAPQEVQLKLSHLSESWKELSQNISKREQSIKQMLQLLQQFDDLYNDLSLWLTDKV